MTENEYTIDELIDFMYNVMDDSDEEAIPFVKEAIQALEKVQAFETIGTIEEFKALKNKHIGKDNMVISSSDLMTILNSDSEELKEVRKGFEENRKAGYKHGYSDGYAKGIDDLVNGLLNWKTQDEEYKSFSDVCNEIAERLKGADMITPIGALNINQIVERKDDLLVSVDDIKMVANDAKNKAIDEFTEEALKRFTELELKDSLATVTYCKTILRDVAEQLKGGVE